MHRKNVTNIRLDWTLMSLNNPRLKYVKDEITGKKYALCLMETDKPDERRIIRHISDYMEPKMLLAYMEGYSQALKEKSFEKNT